MELATALPHALLRRANLPLLLVVAPTPIMARETLVANRLSPDGGQAIRMVTRFTGLRGWRHGMPVIATEVSRWAVLAGFHGQMLEHTLMTMLACGRLRLAQDDDLARARWED